MSKCPSVVKINGYRWKLLRDQKAWDELGDKDILGRTYSLTHTIVIRPRHTDAQEEASTVLHATWKHGIVQDVEDQEGVVAGLEGPLYTVIRDNPKLIAYLQDPDPL